MNDQLTIRPAVPGDLDTINAIIARAIQGWALPERVKRLTLPSLQYTTIDFDFQSLWLAVYEQHPVAMSAWEDADSVDQHNYAPTLLLHGIYVDPSAQGRGVGRCLFAQAEVIARSRNLAAIVVKAQKGSEPFYRALGMVPMAVTDRARHFENRFVKILSHD